MKIERKPEWLQKRINPGGQIPMLRLLEELNLNTVCRQALCPNISECFARNQATFLILGKNCTRHCSFCNVDSCEPEEVDQEEPQRVAQAVARLGLSHVVITSPTRDDLDDGGASLFAQTVRAIRAVTPSTRIELLIPDFLGDIPSLDRVIASAPDILAHNLETVPRLYHIRAGADYNRSLELLRHCGETAPAIRLKSGIMLGLGEKEQEILELFRDLREVGCVYLSIGQYLAPSKRHHPVREYIHPDRFEYLREQALQMGFVHLESGPYVRSSYHAGSYS
ncbi:lipoyl synthase [Pelobacter propionicus]|uniref:Lipoyl synthase n=1 Tax=Pelobacter propionicus (strain DSM 2379 / NBRC 103807 / OttBd1) TaxID=338966 RepID=A1AR76_PELPD|nr:lipoyl synthase [Pelobacter propionicus]ABK99846.1 lipoic acid synthetase [Pelobacter propionicus DSM 2379]